MAKRSPMMDRLDALEAELSALRSTSASNFSTLERELRARSVSGATADRQAALGRLSGGLPSGMSASFRSAGAPDVPAGLGMSMMDRLRAGTALSTGVASGASGDDWTVRGNLLYDPTFEHVFNTAVTIGTSYTDFGEFWQAKYVLNSGTAPSIRSVSVNQYRDTRVGTPSGDHSSRMLLDLGFLAAASDVTFYVRPTVASLVTGSYMLAAIRLVGYTAWSADFTSATARIQIMDSTETTVISESEAYDLLALLGVSDELSPWTVREDSTTSSLWRLRIDIVKAAGSSAVPAFLLTEPQLQTANEPAPSAFSPAIGAWMPSRISTYDAGGVDELPVISSTYISTPSTTFKLWPDGRMEWNGDTELTRDSAGVLAVNGTPLGSGGAVSFSGARLYRSSAQSITTATDTDILWDSEDYDTDAYHTGGGAAAFIDIPATGKYHVTVAVEWAASGAGTRTLWIEKNGAATNYGLVSDANPTAGAGSRFQTSMDLDLVAGDYLVARVRQNSGGNLDIWTADRSTYATIHLLGGTTGADGAAGAAGTTLLTLTEVEKDLGSLPRSAGTFDIAGLSGLTADKQVLVVQKAAAYTGKGTYYDEPEMDHIDATGYCVDATTIRVYWNSPTLVRGNVKFGYQVSS